MKKQENIKNLFKKFSTGSLTPMEAKELSMLVRQGDENPVLKEILTSYWQESANEDVDIPSINMFEKLKDSIDALEFIPEVQLTKKGSTKFFMYLKYAAVIVMTFGLTWLSKDLIVIKISGKMDQTENIANNEISVSYGSKSKVTLPDGSVVMLNSGSILRYPTRFDGNNRQVYVEGEAYFDVMKDKHHPFYVSTNSITIKVLGTKFNVKSYSDEKTVETTLVSGSVEIYSNRKDINDDNRLAILKPNQQATFEVEKSKLSVSDLGNKTDSIKTIQINARVDVNPVIAWKDNRLVFRDENFADLTHKLERWYNVEIEIKDESLKTTLFSGVFEKESIEQSLTALKLATPFNYKIKQNHVTITR